MGMRRWAAAAGVSLAGALVGAQAWAADKIGQPTPGAIDFQPAASQMKTDVIWFHNTILLPITVGISLFVAALLLWVIVRYNKRANPTPAKWSHNTLVEVIWTVVPVLILMFIAIFSFRLLFAYHELPEKPYMTVKATGYQWYWGYEYPDQKVSEITSNMQKESVVKDPALYRLEADTPMVVPVNRLVRVLVTGSDVIHAFAMPAFGVKIDAIPGRVNQTWFKATRIGKYYGQCSELCGVNHAFMPIEIDVVSDADFAAWVAKNGGSMTPAAAPAAAAAAPAAAAPAAPTAAPAAATTAPTAKAAPAAAPAAASQSSAPGATTAPKAQ